MQNFSQWLQAARLQHHFQEPVLKPFPRTRLDLPLLVVGDGRGALAVMGALKIARLPFVAVGREVGKTLTSVTKTRDGSWSGVIKDAHGRESISDYRALIIDAANDRQQLSFLEASLLSATFYIFSSSDPGLSFIVDVKAGESSVPVFKAQADALAAYYEAEANLENPRVETWNHLRRLNVQVEFQGGLPYPKRIYGSPDQYLRFLRDFRRWIRNES